MKETVTSKIGNDYINWKHGDIILIDAGTGAGKSHFVKNTLYEYAKETNKKILLLSNRNKLKEQNQLELVDKLEFGDTITIVNYQKIDFEYSRKLENDAIHNKLNLDDFDYIISDECHYFIDDADFNNFTDYSLNLILNSKGIKIFMSATPDLFVDYLYGELGEIDIITYSIKKDYSYIEKLYIYNDDELLEKTLLDNLSSDEKVIYFHYSAKKCLSLHEKYQNSMWVCSKSNPLYKKVNEEKLHSLLKNEKFEDSILFSTKCLDNGINIKDSNIRHVIINMRFDINTIIQCLGRYRLTDEHDKIIVYIKNVSNQSLGGNFQRLNQRLEKAQKFIYDTEVLDFDPRNYEDDITFLTNNENGLEVNVNWVKYHKVESSRNFIKDLLDKSGKSKNKINKKYPFANYIKSLLHINWYYYDNEWNFTSLADYLNANLGIEMDKAKQEKFKDVLNREGLKVKKGNGIGINTINGYLKDCGLRYYINSKVVRVYGKRVTVWTICKI